jgi:hypothetical protein
MALFHTSCSVCRWRLHLPAETSYCEDADGPQVRVGSINYTSQTTSSWPIYGAAVV